MRVTKVIREYVEREIYAKFEPQLREISSEYDAEREELSRRMKELRDETYAKAIEIAAELGFSENTYYRDAVSIYAGHFENKEKADAINRRRRELENKRTKAIENILLNLELGETTKAELKDAIESVEV